MNIQANIQTICTPLTIGLDIRLFRERTQHSASVSDAFPFSTHAYALEQQRQSVFDECLHDVSP
jgi:hypothetical protein